ncbi:hypothetical protein PR202_ga30040 [Eleusine coracana subsp. coracana]|uniref:Transcription factor IIIC subunit 5 HTH domain-containing protein n=1 Tax=Eleusine coracana subsp. coracana TaxID=191504 RepID=A0AAV5DPJ4_ELECO|nr:hypothetical protein PR202_ga30040 [Eleusine coracana subsp. coracana]
MRPWKWNPPVFEVSSLCSPMVSPPSSPTAAAAEPPPSTITDGTVSGTLPAAEAFAVHYPGYPSSPTRAARTLGGLSAIAKARSSEPGARLELRFRPEDPYCHPAFGESRASTGLVLRLFRRKGDPAPRAEVVARVRTAYHFEDDPAHLETDDEDVMMLVPPLFSLKDKPTKIALLFRAGYYFSTGPFGKFWIRRGYDPRRDSESRISQKWSDMCKLEAMPSKNFVFLQLFELKDDFIQAEIRKPSYQSVCSVSNKNNLLLWSKKQEALCRSEQSNEDKDVDEEAPARQTGNEDEVDPNNSDSEDVDEEEEEDKDSDGYDSPPPMAEDLRDFTLDGSSSNVRDGYPTGPQRRRRRPQARKKSIARYKLRREIVDGNL